MVIRTNNISYYTIHFVNISIHQATYTLTPHFIEFFYKTVFMMLTM